MKKINIAIFGMGRIGETHLKNIIDHPKCYIRYIFDPNPRKVNFLKKKYNVKAAKNISSIFAGFGHTSQSDVTFENCKFRAGESTTFWAHFAKNLKKIENS